MKLDIDTKFVREIVVRFDKEEPTYTLFINEHTNAAYGPGIALPITRAQMLNIIDDVKEARHTQKIVRDVSEGCPCD